MDELEQLWSDILSSDPQRITLRWKSLSPDEAQAIKAHLTNIVEDADYSDTQKDSAREALRIIESLK